MHEDSVIRLHDLAHNQCITCISIDMYATCILPRGMRATWQRKARISDRMMNTEEKVWDTEVAVSFQKHRARAKYQWSSIAGQMMS